MSPTPGWLERTFLYAFGLLGLIILINSTSFYFVPTQTLVVVTVPRPYFGRPSRPTSPRPPPPMSLNISLDTHRKMMGDRVTVMRDVCDKYGTKIKHPKRISGDRGLMWDTKHHLVYCPIYKVASGTWTTNFLRLSQFNNDLPKWQRFSKIYNASESVARKMFPPPKGKKEQKKELSQSTKFLVVRHPFDRIISAFKGKIARPDAKPRRYRTLQKEIKKKYGENKDEDAKGLPPTFREYWMYLIDITKNLVHPKDWRVVDCVQAYYSVCVPCDVEYNVVIKLETHDADTEFMIRQFNLTELNEPFTMWKHNSLGANQIGDYDYYLYEEPYRNPKKFSSGEFLNNVSSEEHSDKERKGNDKLEYKKSLFSQLSKEQVLQLYENYRIDFEMFGYTVDEFLNFAHS